VTPSVSIITPTAQHKSTYNRHYILFHNKINHFLAHLAVEGNDASIDTIAAKHLLGCQNGGGEILFAETLRERLISSVRGWRWDMTMTVPPFAEMVVMPCPHGKTREEVSMDLPLDFG
jgi:hypothetical protein